MKNRLTIERAIEVAKQVSEEKYLEGMLCHANPDDGQLNKYIAYGERLEQIARWLEELKEYKDLEEQGLLLRLPCKVGDTVYKLDSCFWTDREKCESCDYYWEGSDIFRDDPFCRYHDDTYNYPQKCLQVVECKMHSQYYIVQRMSDFGVLIFLTREEAEQALAKMKGEDDD